MFLTALVLSLLAAPQTPLEELRQLELRIEESRRVIPAAFERETEEAAFRKLLELAQLDATITSERIATAPLELWRMEIAGRGDIDALASFLDMAARRDWRLADLESLQSDGKTFKVRLTLPVFVVDAGAANFQDRIARSRALGDAIGRLRSSKRLADAAALFDAWPDQPTLRVTGVNINDAMRIEGVSLGAAARADLLAKLKAAGFAATRLQMPPSGACRPFVLTAVYGSMPTQVVADATLQSPLCDGEAVPAGGRIAARGSGGPLTLSLRNVEFSDVFQILHELTRENFLVDADVKGRVDVELEQATIEEALAAIKGLPISAGPLRRVSLAPRPPLTQTYNGETISMLLTDADIPSVLCLLKEITGLTMLIPPDLKARVTIFARDVPWDHLFDAMIASANLTYKIDGTQVFVGPRATAVASCEVAKNVPWRFTSAPITIEQLAKSDLEVAGVVQQDGTWKAVLHGPRHRFWFVEAGQQLFDAKVKSVGPSGVTFD